MFSEPLRLGFFVTEHITRNVIISQEVAQATNEIEEGIRLSFSRETAGEANARLTKATGKNAGRN